MKTREAYQRQQGIAVTGSIDMPTAESAGEPKHPVAVFVDRCSDLNRHSDLYGSGTDRPAPLRARRANPPTSRTRPVRRRARIPARRKPAVFD